MAAVRVESRDGACRFGSHCSTFHKNRIFTLRPSLPLNAISQAGRDRRAAGGSLGTGCFGLVRAAVLNGDFDRAYVESHRLVPNDSDNDSDNEALAVVADASWGYGRFEEAERTSRAVLETAKNIPLAHMVLVIADRLSQSAADHRAGVAGRTVRRRAAALDEPRSNGPRDGR